MVAHQVLVDALQRKAARQAGLDLVEALVSSRLCASKNAARTAISQGGAYVNNVRRDSGGSDGSSPAVSRHDLLADRYVLLRRGRRDYHVLVFE